MSLEDCNVRAGLSEGGEATVSMAYRSTFTIMGHCFILTITKF